jgi:hypothetical protein
MHHSIECSATQNGSNPFDRGLQWVAVEPNGKPLWARVRVRDLPDRAMDC